MNYSGLAKIIHTKNCIVPKNSNYSSTNPSKHYLKCHPIFVGKYRKKLLPEPLDRDTKEIRIAITDRSDFEIELFESDEDHRHFLIRYFPRLSISSIVRRLKQKSSVAIWKKHQAFLSKHFWKEHTFWSDGYFVCSIGQASPNTIRQYILSLG